MLVLIAIAVVYVLKHPKVQAEIKTIIADIKATVKKYLPTVVLVVKKVIAKVIAIYKAIVTKFSKKAVVAPVSPVVPTPTEEKKV